MATFVIKTDFEETVVQKLNELFGNVLNIDIIRSVAVSCHYDVNTSSDKLLEISNSSVVRMERNFMVEPYVVQENKRKSIQVPPVSLSNKEQRKSKKTLDFERTVSKIQNGSKVLVIIRGVPGCGKSYLAKRILECTIGFDHNYKLHVLSTDDFFCQNGQYQYDASKISDAHGWNHNRAFQALSRGYSPVIIDNTNTQMWEMKPYAMMATDYGYIIEILEPDTHWCSNDKELAKRNIHGVPKSKIRDMLDRYEKNVTPQKLLSAYNLTYRLQKPPQPRLYPPFRINSSPSVSSFCNYNEYIKPSDVDGSSIMKSKSVTALNLIKSHAAVNLMEFNDDESMDSELKYLTNTRVKLSEQNSVDKILMYNNEPMNQNSVLKPSSQTVSEVIKIDSSDDEVQVKQNKLFPDLETAWGITESALRSWDIVTPLKYEGEVKLPQQPKVVHKVMTRDWSTNTDDEYFRLLRSKQITFDSKDYTLLETVNRDINSCTPKRTPAVLKVPMLDKSCLTEDIFEDYDNHMSQLESLFPMMSQENLTYWYTKCKGDLEWTIEFVLENQGVITSLIEDSDTDNRKASNPSTGSDTDSSTSNQKNISHPKEKKFKRHRQESENIALKKIIESKIDFNEHHYSKNVFKIKQYRSINRDNIKVSPSTPVDKSQPSTSKQLTNQQDGSTDEFDEFDYEIIDKPEQKPVEMVELNLGENFVDQLESKFGDSNMSFPKGFQPVVQVPVTLARQLYTFYIESVCQQMENQKHVLDTLIKEDEDFSRKLQASEERVVHVKPASNFKDIIDEQMAQSIYQKEVDKWKELNPDNLASMLTRQKLFSVFPKLDKNTLVEILHAHDNKYQDTVDTLLASTGTEYVIGNIDSIREPPLIDEIVQEMKEAQKSSSSQFKEQLDAKLYREEAGKYLKKRSELYQKAQQYHQRGMREVAQFYSSLASQQTQHYDRANNMAATAFLDEHSKRLQDFNTIDLHFLYVKEAIPALDLFLDRNINLLRLSNNRQTEYVQIITGRGNRSENGISKIKPAVISRLNRRNIKYCVLNPGLLKAKVSKTSLVTSELQNSTD